AYEDLPAGIKARLKGRTATHDFAKFWDMMRARPGSQRNALTPEQRAKKPPVSQPIFRTHPIIGRTILYCNPGYATRIDAMAETESAELLRFLFEHQENEKYFYAHKWSTGDVLMWDNIGTVHNAVPDYRADEPRYMCRVQVMATRDYARLVACARRNAIQGGGDMFRAVEVRAARLLAVALSAGLALAMLATAAAAQTPEIRFARQFSMGYLQFNVMEKNRLIEKHARAAGIPDVKVTWATFNSPAAMNDALLSGSVDIVSGGVPGLLTIWARTQGTANAVKGVTAFSSQPILLNSRNPKIVRITDFTEKDKIAVPAVKISIQAIMLQMAAAKQWGQADFARLDPLTVGMSPPDATVALLSD